MIGLSVDESNNGYDAALPITITVVDILPNRSTSISSHSTTFQPNTTSLSLETTTAVTTSEINILPSQISTSFTPVTSSAPSFSSTLSPSTSSGTPLSQDTRSFSAPLNPGAIAGLVIACVFVFLIGIFFAIRLWFKNKRMSKLRRTWPRSSVADIRYGVDVPESSYEPKLAPGNGNSRGPLPPVENPSLHISVPPMSYNNDAVFQYATPPVTSSPSAFTLPVYSPGLKFLSPYSTAVVCTFIPSLPDELTVYIGESLRVLTGYEDGWSLCMDCRGKQGMVPNECLDQSPSSMGLLPPVHDYRISRSSARESSLAQDVRPDR